MYFFTKLLQGFVWLAITVFQGFVWFIDVVDTIVTTGFFWLLLHKGYGWNGWWALAFGLVVSLILYLILKHRIGFWFVAALFSVIWTALLGVILDGLFPTMPQVLFWVVCAVHFAWGMRCHDYARYRKETDDFCKAKETEDKHQAQLDD